MDNVVQLNHGAKGRTKPPPPTDIDQTLAQARSLLSDVITSLEESNGNADGCHLCAVEKIKSLLCRITDADADDYDVLPAMSLVELARLALAAGRDWFEEGPLDYALSIARALQVALDSLNRLQGEEAANG
jgi:hypothetical protein